MKRKKNVIKGTSVPMLSVQQICEMYGFHPNTVRAWVNRDGLKAEKHGPGGKLFFRQDDVEEFVNTWYNMDDED